MGVRLRKRCTVYEVLHSVRHTVAVTLSKQTPIPESAGEESCISMSSSYDMRNFTAVKGKLPPALPVKGKVTVVESWATWCPPCRTSIPHLNALQLEFKEGLVVVGISDEPEDEVRPFVQKMGNTMQYTVLCLNSNCEPPADFSDIDGIPHALLYGADGTLKFQGHPLDPEFDENVRAELLSAAQIPLRRAVFLQATDLPRMDTMSASDPFCAVFVRKSKNQRWAMCSFGPYFKQKKVYSERDEDKQSKKQVGGGGVGLTAKQDPDTIRNQMMATEVLRNCNDPVWSTPLIFDCDDFEEPSDWEVLFAVYDHVYTPPSTLFYN